LKILLPKNVRKVFSATYQDAVVTRPTTTNLSRKIEELQVNNNFLQSKMEQLNEKPTMSWEV